MVQILSASCEYLVYLSGVLVWCTGLVYLSGFHILLVLPSSTSLGLSFLNLGLGELVALEELKSCAQCVWSQIVPCILNIWSDADVVMLCAATTPPPPLTPRGRQYRPD